MQAIIMAGGFGTRLRPLTCSIPKPMIPVVNRPIIESIVRHLVSHNFTEIFVMLHFEPDQIKRYLGDGSRFGAKIRYIQSSKDLGTAGSIKRAQKYLKDTFLIISGDLLTDVDLFDFYTFHLESKSDASIMLTEVNDPTPYGIVLTDSYGNITRFLEKPAPSEVFSNNINAGIYVLEPHIFDKIPDNQIYDFSRHLFPHLQRDRTKLLGYHANGYWRDIGNHSEYKAAHGDLLNGKIKISPDKTNDTLFDNGKEWKRPGELTIRGKVVIGKNVLIENSTYIANSVIGSNVKIRKGSSLVNTTLWDNVDIGENCFIKDSIIAGYTRIEKRTAIMEDVILGENVFIGNSSRLLNRVTVWPQISLDANTVLSGKTILENGLQVPATFSENL